MQKEKQNNFGALSERYDAARRGYPDELYQYLKELLGDAGVKTLDVGCGTGISTRELRAHGFDAIGLDKDRGMIAIAQKKNGDDATYVVSEVNNLPFEDGVFGLVTAFTALHWFSDSDSLAEIKRVLRHGGLFFVAHKKVSKTEETKIQRRGYHEIIQKYAGKDYQSDFGFSPREILEQNGFTDIKEKSFFTREIYALKDALALSQSYSFWNLIPVARRPAFLEELKSFYSKNLIDGSVVRDREIITVAGTVPA